MSEELNPGVTPEGSQPAVTPPVAETEQPETVSEDVTTQEGDVDYKALYEKEASIKENLKKALKEARTQSKETVIAPPVMEPEVSDDDGVKRFLRTEADAYFAKKLALDPSYREVLPEIESLVNKGIDVRTAEQMVKSARYDTIATQLYQSEETPPNQIKPTSTPEPSPAKPVTIAGIAKGENGATPDERMLADALMQQGL